MRYSSRAAIDHANHNWGIGEESRGILPRRSSAKTLRLIVFGGAFIILAWPGKAGQCAEFGTPTGSNHVKATPRVILVSQDAGPKPAGEPKWILNAEIRITFPAFSLPVNGEPVLVRPELAISATSIEDLVARVDITLTLIHAGLTRRTFVSPKAPVFVFTNDNVGKNGFPTLVASFDRGYLHGPMWLLNPQTGSMVFYGEFEKGMRSGRFMVFDPEGLTTEPWFIGAYTNNRKDGVFMVLEDGLPVYTAYYQRNMLQGEWLVEWVAGQPQLIPVAGALEKMNNLRKYQRKFSWAENLIQVCEPPIKQHVAQFYRKIDSQIKSVLAASYSVAARQRILNRYEQLSAAQKASHAATLARRSAGLPGSPYAAIANDIPAGGRRVPIANTLYGIQNFDTAIKSLFEDDRILQNANAQFHQTILNAIQAVNAEFP